MNRNTKIILSVLGVGITATAIFLIIRNRRKKQEKLSVVQNTFTPTEIATIQTKPLSVSNPPSAKQIDNIVKNVDISEVITNKQEGDAFRNWVNDNYPDYAKQIDLDRSGSYNNSFIKKAWQQYGTEYTQQNTSALSNVANTINDTIASNPILQQVVTGVTQSVGAVTNPFSRLTNVLQGQTAVSNPSGAFDPKIAAENLYRSMKGFGTNEQLFFDTLEPLTKAQRIQVREYYDKNGVGKNLGTLEMSVRGDFGGIFSPKDELQRALALLEL